MLSKFDVKYLNEYLGQYARHLVFYDDEDIGIGMLIEGAARFVAFIEDTIDDATVNNMD